MKDEKRALRWHQEHGQGRKFGSGSNPASIPERVVLNVIGRELYVTSSLPNSEKTGEGRG